MTQPPLHKVPADSVHVWRGYKTPEKNYVEFADFLGQVFVPACALLQPNAGLNAYVPAMPNAQNKPQGVPDQTALMFWTKPDAHKSGFEVPAVRAYTNLHSLVYAEESKSGFPISFEEQIRTEQPYFLIDQPSDWMYGTIFHFVGAKSDQQDSADFKIAIGKWAKDYQQVNESADGALLCVGENYVIFWEHFAEEKPTPSDHFSKLSSLAQPFLNSKAKPYVLPGGLWTPWAGIDVIKHACISIQLIRPIVL